jgi:hypothetical protein
MDYNALLAYVSEIQCGTWEQFKQALRALEGCSNDTHAAPRARLLSALGHIEFSWEAQQIWSICPPVLAQQPHRDTPTAVLCGQRPTALVHALSTQAEKCDVQCLVELQSEGPNVVRVVATTRDQLIELANALEIGCSLEAVERLAMCTPPLSSLVKLAKPVPRPSVPPIQYFNVQEHMWQPVDCVTNNGVYQYENFYPDYRLVQDGEYRRVAPEVGIYTLLGPTVWKYDHETHQLMIPKGLLPPALYQRVLVLCSGFLATYDHTTDYWIYRDIPPAVAYLLATKLSQTLEAAC